MTHTHHTHFDRPTLFFATRCQGLSEVTWGFLLHPSGLSFGFQARCTGSTRTNKRRRFQKSSVVDWMMPKSEEWIRTKRRRRRSIDGQASECMVDLLNLSWDALSGRQCGLSFFVLVDLGNEQSFVYYGGGGLQPKTPVGADNVDSSMSDLVSAFTISWSAFLWQCCTSIFIFVVLHLCTRRIISRQSPLKQTDSSWILHLE